MYMILQQPARVEWYFGTAKAKNQSIKPRNREHFFTQNTHIWLWEEAPLKSEVPAGNSSKLQVQIQSPICAVQKCKTWEELISEE